MFKNLDLWVTVITDLSYAVLQKDTDDINNGLHIEDSAGKQAYQWDNVPEDLSEDAEFLNQEDYFTCSLRPEFKCLRPVLILENIWGEDVYPTNV